MEENDCKLKFLVTSRPYFDIKRRFFDLTCHFPTVRLAGEEESEAISLEIERVIEVEVERIGQRLWSDAPNQKHLKEYLKEQLLKFTNQTYLWVKLMFDFISSSAEVSNQQEIKQLIDSIPTTLEEAYEAILKKSPNINRARKLLHIIVAATRPLSVKEMNVALNIEEGRTALEEDVDVDSEENLEEKMRNIYGLLARERNVLLGIEKALEDADVESEKRVEEKIRNICGLFVNIVESRVYLIHQTAKEFLIA
ncbi:hypothetical protein VTN96DRAFT_1030 [Rasamsonia emersonii]